MANAEGVVREMCDAYASAVNAGDSSAYGELFTPDAIRVPPGRDLERGREAIAKGEQAIYDWGKLMIRSTPVDVVQLSEDWIYALAEIEGEGVAHTDGATSSFRATKALLLQRQSSGDWLLARHMWNTRAD